MQRDSVILPQPDVACSADLAQPKTPKTRKDNSLIFLIAAPIRRQFFLIMRLNPPRSGNQITEQEHSSMAIKKSGAAPRKGSSRKSVAKNAGAEPTISLSNHLPATTEAEIRRRAYELYEARGRADGFDREDWVQAEAEIRSRLQKKESA